MLFECKRHAPLASDRRTLSRNALGGTFVSILGYDMEQQALESHRSPGTRYDCDRLLRVIVYLRA